MQWRGTRGVWRVGLFVLVLWICFIIYISNQVSSNTGLKEQLQLMNNRLKRLESRGHMEQNLLIDREQGITRIDTEVMQKKRLNNDEEGDDTVTAADQKDSMKLINQELDKLTLYLKSKDLTGPDKSKQSPTISPSLENEIRRRSVYRSVKEFWLTLSSLLGREKNIAHLLPQLSLQKNAILKELDSLEDASGATKWRMNESLSLGKIVRDRIKKLQNPSNCKSARKLLCKWSRACGFGCGIHRLAYCLMLAYGSGRVFTAGNNTHFSYGYQRWDSIFLPYSDHCSEINEPSHIPTFSDNSNAEIVEVGTIENLHNPRYAPLAAPEELFDKVHGFHTNPPLWFASQFVAYLWRLQPTIEGQFQAYMKENSFDSPIVGVHIRRTDKLMMEAKLHTIEEYMTHVEDYFQKLKLSEVVPTKRVFIATDDPTVLTEAKEKYPDYEILGDMKVSKLAQSDRYSKDSLFGIVKDIYLLSRTDFLVCTFSSQVCRMAYELMQTVHGDASERFRSLDDVYYYGGQRPHRLRAIYPHIARSTSEIDLLPGDKIDIAGNHWDGFSKGVNTRTGEKGLFPSWKVDDYFVKLAYPTY